MTTGGRTAARALHETEIDGVTTFFVESSQTPAAVLTFRAGFTDESLVQRGWLHLLEHRAMHGTDDPRLHTNASVGPMYTDFHVTGDQDDVVAFLRDLSQRLADPDLSDLEHERSVLEAESAQRTTGDWAVHLDYRFGAHGVGTAVYPELGLLTATETDLRATSARFFTSGNAALGLSFRPPDDLALPLPRGERVPAPELSPLRLKLPGHAGSPTRDLAVSGMLRRNEISMLVGEVLSRAATRRLRHELGSSYGTQWAVERLDEQRLMLLLVSDLLDKHAETGVAQLHDALHELRSVGVDPEVVDAIRERMVRQVRDVPDGVWQAFNSAASHLRGSPPVREEEMIERLMSASVDDVQDEVNAFLDSSLYTSPAGSSSRTTLPFNTGLAPARIEGASRTFRPWEVDDSSVMELSAHALRVAGASTDLCVRFAEVAALLAYPDGRRTIVGRDGCTITLEPHHWVSGGEAVAAVDAAVDGAMVVTMPERDPSEVPALPAPGRRMLRRIRHFLARPGMEVAFFATLAVIMAVVAIASGGRHVGPVFLFAVVALALHIRNGRSD